MSVNGLNSALSGLYANQYRQNVAANNVANANTDGFKASEVQTQDAGYVNDIGQGTRVAGTYAPDRPGPVAVDTAGAASGGSGVRELSNTDMVNEMTGMMGARNAYNASAQMVRTVDETAQTVLNLQA